MAQLKKFIFVVLHSLSLFLSLSTQLELEWDVDEEENWKLRMENGKKFNLILDINH